MGLHSGLAFGRDSTDPAVYLDSVYYPNYPDRRLSRMRAANGDKALPHRADRPLAVRRESLSLREPYSSHDAEREQD